MQGFAKGCQVAFNMETGPISNALCVGRKGTMIGAFTVKGVSAHSGNNFEAGRNAIVEAAHKMLDIDALTDMEKGTNMNVAVVQGGKMWNSVPDYCKVDFSGRFAQTAEMERVMAVIPIPPASPVACLSRRRPIRHCGILSAESAECWDMARWAMYFWAAAAMPGR